MSDLDPNKLFVTHQPGDRPAERSASEIEPRRYTLTHSDMTGDLFLSIGHDYDQAQLSGWQTRLMRDEVLAEWKAGRTGPELHVHCHVSGGLIFGGARWRYQIFQRHMRQVLEAFRHGDRELIEDHPDLDDALVYVHFYAPGTPFDGEEHWGVLGDYRIDPAPLIIEQHASDSRERERERRADPASA